MITRTAKVIELVARQRPRGAKAYFARVAFDEAAETTIRLTHEEFVSLEAATEGVTSFAVTLHVIETKSEGGTT